MEVIRYLKVKVKINVPDATDKEDAAEAANALLDDCDYSFTPSDHHLAEGLSITDTEIMDYGEDEQKFN